MALKNSLIDEKMIYIVLCGHHICNEIVINQNYCTILSDYCQDYIKILSQINTGALIKKGLKGNAKS